MSEQTIFGLFYEDPFGDEATELLGIFLESDVESVRQAYVDDLLVEHSEEEQEEFRDHYLKCTVVRHLPLGRLLH